MKREEERVEKQGRKRPFEEPEDHTLPLCSHAFKTTLSFFSCKSNYQPLANVLYNDIADLGQVAFLLHKETCRLLVFLS